MTKVSPPTRLYNNCCDTSVGTCQNVTPNFPCGPIAEASPCPENNCLEIRTIEYNAALKTGADFVIPACGQTAIVNIPGLTLAHVGSFIYNTTYGYLRITGYDSLTQTIVVENTCAAGNASPGTTVPNCTTFIVTDAPCDLVGDSIPYLTTDFIIPIVGGCTSVGVTDSSTFEVGYTVQIGSSQYNVGSIINATTLQICNTGGAAPVGGTVQALNSGGQYQYPVIVLSTSSTFDNEDIVSAVTINVGNLVETAQSGISYTNLSPTDAAQVMYTISGYADGDCANGNTDVVSFDFELLENINGAGFVQVQRQGIYQFTIDDAAYPLSKQVQYTGVATVPAGQTFTLDAQSIIRWSGTGTAEFTADTLESRVAGIAVVS